MYKEIPCQQTLWDNQHGRRNIVGNEGTYLRDIPNESAEIFDSCLISSVPPKVIFEVGSANGRDARYWAKKGHFVYATDFSKIALKNLNDLSFEQGLNTLILPIYHDISTGQLPKLIHSEIDAFYARSALHVDDTTMDKLAIEICAKLKSGGLILIEGKTPEDYKIKRSEILGNGLVVDYIGNGHLRRVWDKKYLIKICNQNNLDIVTIDEYSEIIEKEDTHFVRLIAKKY
jgi:hypothetical protein